MRLDPGVRHRPGPPRRRRRKSAGDDCRLRANREKLWFASVLRGKLLNSGGDPNYDGNMPILADCEAAALRFMKQKPLRVDPFAPVADVERVAAMLDQLSRMGLCRRTLDGLNRVYSITPDGLQALSQAGDRGEIIDPAEEPPRDPDDAKALQSAAE